jgi:alkaline phosphatase
MWNKVQAGRGWEWLVLVILSMGSLGITAGCSAEPVAGELSTEAESQALGGGHGPRHRVRNVIVFVNDGTSLPQLNFALQRRRLETPDAPPGPYERLLAAGNFGFADVSMLDPQGRATLTVDSAASATQIACGVPTIPQVTGLDQDGYPCETALERARHLGMATGLVTDARITHATPAAFVAKQISRSAELDIASEYIVGDAAGKVDVLLGGGARYFIPTGTRVTQIPECRDLPSVLDGAGQRTDGRNLVDAARSAGYRFVCNAAQLAAVPEQAGTKVLGTFGTVQFPNYPERADIPGLPSLEAVTRKAVRILEHDPHGFFLVVEAGLIDYGAHEHDGAYVLRAMEESERMAGFLLRYTEQHPDTLLVITGDHETGSPGFSYRAGPRVTTTLPSGLVHTLDLDFAPAVERFTALEHQTLSLGGMVSPIIARLYGSGYQPNPAYPLEQGVTDLMAAVADHSDFTITADEARWVLSVAPGTTVIPFDGFTDPFFQDSPFQDRLALVLADQTQLVWATGQHSSLPVMVFAAGPHRLARRVVGYHHTTDIGELLFDALGGR